jgi:mannose-6-phosphate isomerase-like protein (cupin superfamily)
MPVPPGVPRFRSGDVIENHATGERAVVLVGSEESSDRTVAVHLFVRPGNAGIAEHVHPSLSERFRVIEGSLGVRIGGRDSVLEKGADVTIRPGVAHNWWNAGPGEAQVLIEIDPGERFELLMSTLFGLANDRMTSAEGRPHLLQLAVIAREFRDVIELVKPPRIVQRLLFGLLAPIGQALGYQPYYARYLRPHGRVEPDRALLTALDERRRPAAA